MGAADHGDGDLPQHRGARIRRTSLTLGDELDGDSVAGLERQAVIARQRVGQLGDGDPALLGALGELRDVELGRAPSPPRPAARRASRR